MVKCTQCGKEIQNSEKISICERDQSYHVRCSPDDLLNDAIAEWNAILLRGVRYFVNKYMPGKMRGTALAGKKITLEDLTTYSEVFTNMGRAYRLEFERRKRN